MSENLNAPFTVRRAVAMLRQDALRYLPGGHDEAWRNAVAAAWDVIADEMELYGARVVPFIGQRGMDPDAVTIIAGGTGYGNTVWTATYAAACAYIGKDHASGSQ